MDQGPDEDVRRARSGTEELLSSRNLGNSMAALKSSASPAWMLSGTYPFGVLWRLRFIGRID